LLARIYAARGVQQAADVNASLAGLPAPGRLLNADRAAIRLADAIEQGERLLIVADYDADGATACAVGVRGRLFERFMRVEHPVLVAAVGAAFALSFDTISQAVLFSITGSNLAGWLFAALLGLVFTAGMMATDALNGLWVSHLVRSADRRAAAASRLMSLAIGLSSLAIAALAAARFALPAFDQRVASWGVALSAAVVVTVAVSYGVAMRLAAREA